MGEKVSCEYLIRECDLDSFGHVNNVSIFQYLENARWDLIAQNGFNGVEEMAVTKRGPIVLAAEIQFRRELRVRERIQIHSEWLSFQRRIGVLRQDIFNSQQKLACRADYKMGLFDLQTRKLVTPDERWLRALGLSKL